VVPPIQVRPGFPNLTWVRQATGFHGRECRGMSRCTWSRRERTLLHLSRPWLCGTTGSLAQGRAANQNHLRTGFQ